MATKYISLRNLRFLLHEVHKVSDLTDNYDYFRQHDQELIDMMLDTAKQIADKELHPFYQEMDTKHVPEVQDGITKVHPQIANVVKAMGEGGWISAIIPEEHGGMQLPSMVNLCAQLIFQAANNGVMFYPELTAGAAKLILSFGSEDLKNTYLQKMYAGEWIGTMALTEPEAGSSLADLTTSASPIRDGSYRISGQKIFISAGDNDFSENTIHLLLARIQGAPAGTKGISLFVVPKYRSQNGKLVDNDVISAGAIHKMGQKASPAMHLIFGEKGDCRGYLVGEPNKGLKYMFQLMNSARIEVGIIAASISSAAYYASLQYAHERKQGRKIDQKNIHEPQVSIIEHADVKRMLLYQKAITEGAISLILEAGKAFDLSRVGEGEIRERNQLLLDLLTPIVKVFPSEEGVKSVSQGMQVLGGYGYTEDFPLEQMLRDIRITPIYEGTTAIQSMDLLGRKVLMKGGKPAMVFFEEMSKTIAQAAQYEALKPYAKRLKEQLKDLQKVTMHLTGKAMQGDLELFLADANLYMEMVSIIAISWQWLKQATVAQAKINEGKAAGDDLQFLKSKVHTMKFYFHYELPRTAGLITRLLDDETLTIDCKDMLV